MRTEELECELTATRPVLSCRQRGGSVRQSKLREVERGDRGRERKDSDKKTYKADTVRTERDRGERETETERETDRQRDRKTKVQWCAWCSRFWCAVSLIVQSLALSPQPLRCQATLSASPDGLCPLLVLDLLPPSLA